MAFIGASLACAVIGYLTTKALDYVKDHLKAPDKEKLKQSLTGKLPTIQSILDAIGENMILESESAALEEWLLQLERAIEEADDAIDEVEYHSLEKARRQKMIESSHFPILHFEASLSKKIRSSRQRLKIAIQGLDVVVSGVGNFLGIVDRMKNSSHPYHHRQVLLRETSRMLSVDMVLGRISERNQLVEWLTGVQSPHDVAAIAIVGIGGMGKTTLAQFVCKDSTVTKHFEDRMIWIHISTYFDPIVLTKKIVESITNHKSDADSLDKLQSTLEKLLQIKRVLVILDDAWEDSENHNIWQQFLAPFCNACAGTRILITTRMNSVVNPIKRIMKRSGKGFLKLDLGGLGNRDMLEIFKSNAMSGTTIGSHKELQLISEQIVKKFIGSPLVATSVGRKLWNEKDRSNWSSILNKKFQQFTGPNVMDVLKLSYLNLSSELQICFRYCSIFPRGHKFKMEELVDMWICSRLILPRKEDGLGVDATARYYFNVLKRKSLFSVAAPGEDYYMMHDLVYELACSVSSKEVVKLEAADSEACVPLSVRHLSIEGTSRKIFEDLSHAKGLHLRTLVIRADEDGEGYNEPGIAENLNKLIKGNTGLRVLSIHGKKSSVLKIKQSKLKHLRYISMSHINGSDLCEVFKLHHLEVLKIKSVNHQGEKSLSGIDNLLQLRKLDLPEGTLSLISHIGRLTALQELNGFAVRGEEGHQINQLRNLMKLQKVGVLDVQNVRDHNEASSAELSLKAEMRLLSLQWSTDTSRCHNEEVLEGLAPGRDLRELSISGFTSLSHPRWMNIQCLPNLVHLKLEGCVGWLHLPTLSMLHTLRHLYLGRLLNNFSVPATDLEDWIPPCLSTLVVKECPAILKLPRLPLTLQLLDVCQAGINRLPSSCINQLSNASAGLSELRIESCQRLDSYSCLQQLIDYTGLTKLSIVHCDTLDFLPAGGIFLKMSKLETIVINDCNRLFSLGGLGSVGCLRELFITNCPNLVSSLSCPVSMVHHSTLLETLEVDDHKLLSVKPLCDFNTKHLVITNGSEMTALPLNWLVKSMSELESITIRNAKALESLPSEMKNFTALRAISLTNVLALQLPTKLPPQSVGS